MPDDDIRLRLATEADLVFLTQDTEFADLSADTAATVNTVIISSVPQSLPIAARVSLWLHAIDAFLQHPGQGRLLEVLPEGRVVGWEIRDG